MYERPQRDGESRVLWHFAPVSSLPSTASAGAEPATASAPYRSAEDRAFCFLTKADRRSADVIIKPRPTVASSHASVAAFDTSLASLSATPVVALESRDHPRRAF